MARRALRQGYEVGVVTWVPAGAAIAPGMLHARDHHNRARVWKRRLRPTSMRWFLGGVDISLNEDGVGNTATHWAPHLHGMAATESIAQLKRELKKAAGSATEVKRSTRIDPWDGRLNAAMYPLAGEFDRRVRRWAKRFDKSTGQQAPCVKISDWKLLAVQKLELLQHLDETGLQSRIFTVRAQVHPGPDGVRIRLL